MKDPLELNPKTIASFIYQHYGLKPTTVNFLPKGEDGVLYQIKDENNREYILKFFHVRRQSHNFEILRFRMELARFLREKLKLNFAVTPSISKDSQTLLRYQDHSVALFPFISGKFMADYGLNLKQLELVARAVAQLHNTHDFNGFSLKEDLRPGFTNSLERFLIQLNQIEAKNEVQQKVIKVLSTKKNLLLADISQWRQLQNQLNLNRLVLTHGDLSPGNIIFNPKGHLKIIDWDCVSLSLPENDLNLFTDRKYFADFIKFYREQVPQQALRLQHFAYFQYRWSLEGVWERIDLVFNQAPTLIQQKHELKELTKELHGHGYIKTNLKFIAKVLK